METQTKKCPFCGEEILEEAQKCRHCGEWLGQKPVSQNQKSRTIAVVLALFLGGVGAHKFYLGKPGQGLLYVLFVWSFIPAIFGFIEALNYLSMGEDGFAKRYNNVQGIEAKVDDKKKTPSALVILLAIAVIGIFVGIISVATNSQKNNSAKTTTTNSGSNIQTPTQAPVAKAELPAEPQARIEAIIKNQGTSYEITIFDKKANVGSKIKPPFEVLINTDAGSCASAKQMNFDVMKDLYTDDISSKNIARIRFNARRYLSTSLGGDDARESTAKTWAESGPTNFLTVLTQMGNGDLSYKEMERQTWGKPLEGCK